MATTAERRTPGEVLGTSGRRPAGRLMGGIAGILAAYYTLLVVLVNRHTGPTYSPVTLLITPVGLALGGFAALCLAKILLDIALSNRSTVHEESYHQLVRDIQMAKDDLRSKGISVD